MVTPSRRTVLRLLAIALFVWVMVQTPFDTVLEPWMESLEEAGPMGMASFVVVGVLLSLLLVPVTLPMTLFFPFMIGSLFFGSLKLKFWPYLLIGFLGTVPAKFLQVFAGAVAHESYTSPEGPSGWEAGMFLFSVGIFLVVSWRIGKVTHQITLDQWDRDA